MKKIYTNINTKIPSINTIMKKYLHNSILSANFIYKSDFKNTKKLREYILVFGKILGFKRIWNSRFELIIDELNNNAIEYGSRKGDKNEMRFIAIINKESIDINIEVEDSGNGEKAKKSSGMNKVKEEKIKHIKTNKKYKDHIVRGKGLFLIIETLVDKLYFNDSKKGGLIVGINKKIKK